MKLTPVSALASVVVVGALGFLCGRLSSAGPGAVTADTDSKKNTAYRPSRPSDSANRAATAKRPDVNRDTTATAPLSEKLKRFEAIMRGEDALDRNRALLAFVDQLAPGEFEGVVAHFRSLGMTEHRLSEYSILLTGWAKVNPDAALTYAKGTIGSPFATNTILAALAATDPEGAIRWAEANHTGNSANPYLTGIIRSLAVTDPDRATALLGSMPYSRERAKAFDALMPNIIAKGPDAARAWISTLTDASLRTNATMATAEKFAQTDPRATADWLLSNPGEATSRSFDNVLGTWALMDTAAALAYYEALPPGEARSNALRGIVGAVATLDPDAAANMMSAHPGDILDNTLQGFVKHSLDSAPALAIDYIAQISNPNEREQLYRKTLDSWLGSDPAAAQAWMQKNTLPPKVLRHYQP